MTALVDATEDLFAAERPRLIGLAYRILGSRVDAEDVVQEAWLRLRRSDIGTIDRPAAWLTTVVSRLALDELRSARHRREVYVGPWLPEPVRTSTQWSTLDPLDAALVAESITAGFLRVLETLEPEERVVFLLADVFRVPHDEIAGVIGRSTGATRQVASRARRRVRENDPERALVADGPDAERVVDALVDALLAGDLDRVTELVTSDVVVVSDGGAAVHAGRRPVIGAHRASRFLVNLAARIGTVGGGGEIAMERVALNGEPGLVVRVDGDPALSVGFSVDGSLVAHVWIVLNPDKLRALGFDPVVR